VVSLLSGSGINLQDLPSATARPPRRYRYLVFDGLDSFTPGPRGSPPVLNPGGLVGEWTDVLSDPDFEESVGSGAGDMTVLLPGEYGNMRTPNEPGAYPPTLVGGYRVDVMVTTPDADDWRVLYRGTIEGWRTPLGGGTVSVTLKSLARVAEGRKSPGAWSITANTTLHAAKAIVDTYLPGLAWDSENPTPTGGTPTIIDLPAGSMLDALRHLAGLGTDTFVWVSARGTVVWMVQTRAATGVGRGGVAAGVPAGAYRHLLYTGAEIIDGELGAEPSQVKKVSVITGYGVGTATALDYDANDAREVVVTDATVTDLIGGITAANTRAAEYLARWNRTQLNGELVVSGKRYLIEDINVGDAIRVMASRGYINGTTPGTDDYAAQDVYAMSRHYDGASGTVTIQVDQPQSSVVSQVQSIGRRLDLLEQLIAPAVVVQGGLVSSKGEGAFLKGDPAGQSGTVAITGIVDTTGSATGSLKIKDGLTTKYIPLSATPV
jgi:hypothetical protein